MVIRKATLLEVLVFKPEVTGVLPTCLEGERLLARTLEEIAEEPHGACGIVPTKISPKVLYTRILLACGGQC